MAEKQRKRVRKSKYQLLELVEEGLTGKVYRARNTETGEDVTLKILDRSLAGTSRSGRRSYEMPPGEPQPPFNRGYVPYPPPQPRGVHPATVFAVLLALILVGLVGYLLGGYQQKQRHGSGFPAAPRDERQSPAVPLVQGGNGPDVPVEIPEDTKTAPAPPEQTPAERREADAKLALEEAESQWRRLSLEGDYQAGVLAFDSVANDYPGTAPAAFARQRAGRVHREWGAACENIKDYDAALARYRQALALLAEDEPYARAARARMSPVLAKLAEAARSGRDPAAAVKFYNEALRYEPDDKGRAGLRLKKAAVVWQDMHNYEDALEELKAVAEDFPETRAALDARDKLPEVHAAAVQHYFDEGDYTQARSFAAGFLRDYTDHERAAAVRDTDARTLFEMFQSALEKNDDEKRRAHYEEIFKLYGDTDWANRALWRVLNRNKPPTALTPAAVQQLMATARKQHSEGQYRSATDALELILRSSSDRRAPAYLQAREALPEWLYKAAADLYSKGRGQHALIQLDRITTLLPNTEWAAEALAMRNGIANPPEGMVYVPAGTFTMGTETAQLPEILRSAGFTDLGDEGEKVKILAGQAGLLEETPAHAATTRAFFIDRTEVTNKDYKRFVDETGLRAPTHWEGGAYDAGADKLPVVNVSLDDARAYAKSREARLPTEAEWEKACRGAHGRIYPWGDKFDADKCHHLQPTGEGPAPVGSFPKGASPYGCLDMIGNVAEWTDSPFVPYPDSGYTPEEGDEKLVVTRGAAWHDPGFMKLPARGASRYPQSPRKGTPAIGFRCVKDVRPAAEAPE